MSITPKPLYAVGALDEQACRRALTHYYAWDVLEADGGAWQFRAFVEGERGTPRTRTRVLTVRWTPAADGHAGMWESRAGIRYLESRAPWRPMRTPSALLEARTFARVAFEHASEQLRAAAAELREKRQRAEWLFADCEPAPARTS